MDNQFESNEHLNSIELYRMQMAAISTAAECNTRKSALQQRIPFHSQYYTPAYRYVCEAVDREISTRDQLNLALKELSRVSRELGYAQAEIDQLRAK